MVFKNDDFWTFLDNKSSLLEELLNMEIYARPLVWKSIMKFDYITTAKEDEKYLTAEEISILLIYVNMLK